MECRTFLRKNGLIHLQRIKPEPGSRQPLSDTEELILELLEKIDELSDKLKPPTAKLQVSKIDRLT